MNFTKTEFYENDDPNNSGGKPVKPKQEETFPDPDPPDRTNYKSNDDKKIRNDKNNSS